MPDNHISRQRRAGLQTHLRNTLDRLLVAALLLAAFAFTPPAGAANKQDFDIPAGPLGQALSEFAATAGVLLSFDPSLVEGKTSTGLSGEYGIDEGFEKLLGNSELEVTATGDNNYVIHEVNAIDEGTSTQAPKETGSMQLGQMTVEGQHMPLDPGRTEGTGSYTTDAVTIGKAAQSLRDIPQSVSVITRQQLDDQNAYTLEKAMRYATGISVDEYGTGTQNISARGYDFNSYQIDGMPIDTGYGTWDTSFFDMAMYDRIEVWRGPAGLLQGAGDPGGTVNFVRKRAQREYAVRGLASVGSWDAYRGEIDVTGPLTDDGALRGRAVAVYNDRESFTDYVSSETKLFYGTLEYDFTPATTLRIGAAHQESEHLPFYGLSVYADGTLPDISRSTFLGADWNDKTDRATSYFSELNHMFANGGEASISVRHLYRRSHSKTQGWGSTFIDPATGNVGMLPIAIATDQRDTALDAHVSMPFEILGRQNEWLAGVSWQYTRRGVGYNVSSYGTGGVYQNIFDADVNIPRPGIQAEEYTDTTTEQPALYGQLRLRPLPRTTVLLGGRLGWWETSDDYNPSSQQSITREFVPYAGLMFDVSQSLSLYTSYSNIFNPQTARDHNDSFLPPREGDQYEVGIKGEFYNKRLNAHAAVFHIEDHNRAITDPSAPPGLNYAIAAGKVVSEGFETEISGMILPRWQLTAGYVYTDTQYEKGGAGVFNSQVPEHLFTLWTRYDFGRGMLEDFSIGGGLKAQSETWYENGDTRWTQPGYALASLQLGYSINPDSEVTLTVDNLFDKKYFAKIWGTRQTYFGEPRNVTLTWRTKF